jgi:signal transduction histidine kinase
MIVHTLAPLADALQFLAEQTELASIVQAILQPAAAHTGAQQGALFLLQGEQLSVAAVVHASTVQLQPAQGATAWLDEHWIAEFWLHGKEAPANVICLPLQRTTRRFGLLYLVAPQGLSFSPEQAQFARMFVTCGALSLEHRQLFAEFSTQMAEQAHNEDILRALVEGTATSIGVHFFPVLAQQLVRAFGVRCAFVTECTNQAMTRLRTLAYVKDEIYSENIEYNVAGTPCEQAIAGAISYYPHSLMSHFPEEVGVESYLGAPLRGSDGGVLGHLALADSKPMAFGTREIALLEIFAARAGAELERKRVEDALYRSQSELERLNLQLQDVNVNLEASVVQRTREIQRRQEVAESLREMLSILNTSRPLRDILDYIVVATSRQLGADGGAVFELQPDGKTLLIQAEHGLPPAYAKALQFPLDRSFMGRTVVSGQPLVVPDLARALATQDIGIDPGRQAILAESYRTLLTLPLMRQREPDAANEVYGGIALYYVEPRHFGGEEIELFVAFGAQAALALENARLRYQVESSAVQAERSRLARDLHDSVTQSLYSLTLLAEGWRRMARNGRLESVEDALQELGEIGQQALKEMRLLIYELRPPDLDKEGLVGALYQRLRAVEKRAGVEIHLNAGEVGELSPALEEGLYWLAHEALNNSLKHAGAIRISVQLQRLDQHIELTVVDDGVGFDTTLQADGAGLGLRTMKERVEKMGATLTIESSPGQGVTVRVLAPCAMPPDASHLHSINNSYSSL